MSEHPEEALRRHTVIRALPLGRCRHRSLPSLSPAHGGVRQAKRFAWADERVLPGLLERAAINGVTPWPLARPCRQDG